MSPLKVAIVGCGGIVNAHLPAFREHASVVRPVACCDVVEANARKRAADLGVDRVYTDLATLLRETDVDAVDICSTHDAHAELALTALAAGKHVLVEKPMACSMSEARAMVAAAERSGVQLMVAQMQRYHPSYRGLKRLLDSGELGPIRAVRFDAMQNAPDGIGANHWLLDGKRAGGGVVISLAVHKLDLVRYLLGEVTRVTAACRSLHPAFKHGAEDYAVGLLEFASGAVGEFFGSYSSFRQPWSESFMIFGDDGAVHAVPALGSYSGPAFYASRNSSPPINSFGDIFTGFSPVPDSTDDLPTPNPYTNQILAFAHACRTNTPALSSGHDNLHTMALVCGLYESSRQGKPIDLATI